VQATERDVVVGVFEDAGWAEKAIDDLHHAGFADDQVGVLTRQGVTEARTATGVLEAHAAQGALAGAVTGGTIGAVAGAAVVALVPGIGPVIAGGILAGVVGGLAAGAAVGPFAGPFIALGLSENEARHCEEAFHAGQTVVVVKAPGRSALARSILRRDGAHEPGGVDIVPGRYRHFKGGLYQVLGVARHSETNELLVVYRDLSGDGALWVRPLGMFQETVTVDGREVPRFQRLEAGGPDQAGKP
jgi:hypothetical protein